MTTSCCDDEMDCAIQKKPNISYDFEVVNIKASVKLPNPVDLNFVVDRCLDLSKNTTGIYCSKRTNNILTIRYNNSTFVLFKRSLRSSNQHCNITKCKTEADILQAVQDILYLINQTPIFLNYTIDNYTCFAKINHSIDIESLYLKELDLTCSIQEVHFPSLYVRCPAHLTSAPRLVCQIYKNGSITLVGGKILSEVEGFFQWLLEKITPYIVGQ